MNSDIGNKPFKHNKPFQKFREGGGNKPYGKNKSKRAAKRNDRFFKNVKGFGKKGNFGRGTHIEEEDFTYFTGILETQRKMAFAALDEKVSMANNVMEQTVGKEVHHASNQVVCKVLESLIGFADAEHLERFFEVFGEAFRPVISDVHASHVLEKMMESAFIRSIGQNVITTEEPEEEEGGKAKRPKQEFISDVKYGMTNEFPEEHRTKCAAFVLRIGKFLLNNLEDFVWDKCGNHLLRTAILNLAGVHIPKTTLFKRKILITDVDRLEGSKNGHHIGQLQLNKTIFKVPTEWMEVMNEFPERLQMWPQFIELPYKYRSSGLLQVICYAFAYSDRDALEAFGMKILKDTFMNAPVPKSPYSHKEPRRDENEEEKNGKHAEDGEGQGDEEKEDDDENEVKIKEEENNDKEEEEECKEEECKEEDDEDTDRPSVFKSDAAIRLLQIMLAVAGPKLQSKICELYEGRIISLCKGKYTHFAVERLINYIIDKSKFEKYFDELCPHFEKFLQTNRASLVSALSGACHRLKVKQAAYVTALQNTLHCNASLGAERPKTFFNCLVKMKPFEVLPYDKANYVVLHGSLIIQDILQYNKPIFLVNCMLETPPKDLIAIVTLPNGSFIVDRFLKSTTIGEKSREKFIKLFEGFYLDLAIARSGSRVLEELFNAANETQKVVIAKELTAKENKLKGTVFGRIVYNVLRLETFKLSQDQWKASWTAEAAAAVKVEAGAVETENTDGVTTPPSNKKKNKGKKRPAS